MGSQGSSFWPFAFATCDIIFCTRGRFHILSWTGLFHKFPSLKSQQKLGRDSLFSTLIFSIFPRWSLLANLHYISWASSQGSTHPRQHSAVAVDAGVAGQTCWHESPEATKFALEATLQIMVIQIGLRLHRILKTIKIQPTPVLVQRLSQQLLWQTGKAHAHFQWGARRFQSQPRSSHCHFGWIQKPSAHQVNCANLIKQNLNFPKSKHQIFKSWTKQLSANLGHVNILSHWLRSQPSHLYKLLTPEVWSESRFQV